MYGILNKLTKINNQLSLVDFNNVVHSFLFDLVKVESSAPINNPLFVNAFVESDYSFSSLADIKNKIGGNLLITYSCDSEASSNSFDDQNTNNTVPYWHIVYDIYLRYLDISDFGNLEQNLNKINQIIIDYLTQNETNYSKKTNNWEYLVDTQNSKLISTTGVQKTQVNDLNYLFCVSTFDFLIERKLF